MSDYALWRDFDWESFESELNECPTEKDREELRLAVTLVRTYLRVFSSNRPSHEELKQVINLEKVYNLQIFSHALCIATQIANAMSEAKRRESHKLTFAITAIAHAAKHCKEEQFEKVLPVLTRFAKEV